MLLSLIGDSLVFLPAVFDAGHGTLAHILLRLRWHVFRLLTGPIAVLFELLNRVEEGQTEALLSGGIFIRLLKAGSSARLGSTSNLLAGVASLTRFLSEKVR